MSSPTSTWAGEWSSFSEAFCEGHLIDILVLVVGSMLINNFQSRVILGTSRSRRRDRFFQFAIGLQSWMPSLSRSEASVPELFSDSSRCVVAMSFSRLRSLGKHSRRHIKGRVLFMLLIFRTSVERV